MYLHVSGPAGQHIYLDHVYSTNVGCERRNVSAPAVKLKRRQRETSGREGILTKRDEKCSDASVLRLSDVGPRGFGTNGVKISPQDVRNLCKCIYFR